MKKYLLPLIISLSLVGCTNPKRTGESESNDSTPSSESEPASEDVDITLSIACPSGAPALSLYKIFAKSNVEINADANNVLAYLSPNSTKDIIIAPTNAIAAIQKKNAPFKIAATITFGNFYIASTGNDANGTLDKDDYLVLFQQNGLPDKIFKYVYGSDYTNIHYVTAASDAASCAISGINISDNNKKVDYVLVPQPALTNVLSKNANAAQYANVQEDYKTVSNGLELTQASIFVNTNADKTQVDAFLRQAERDINGLLANPELIVEALDNLENEQAIAKFGAAPAMLKKVLTTNSIGLGYKNALDNKASIDNFLTSLGFLNEATTEEIYYQ